MENLVIGIDEKWCDYVPLIFLDPTIWVISRKNVPVSVKGGISWLIIFHLMVQQNKKC